MCVCVGGCICMRLLTSICASLRSYVCIRKAQFTYIPTHTFASEIVSVKCRNSPYPSRACGVSFVLYLGKTMVANTAWPKWKKIGAIHLKRPLHLSKCPIK